MRLIDADALVDALMTYTWRDEDERTIDDADEKREYIKGWLPNVPTVGGWISVKDRMPEKYFDVLVLVQYPKVNGYTGHYVVIAWKSTDDDSWDSDNNNFNNDPEGVVTHWMPLPETPKEESND